MSADLTIPTIDEPLIEKTIRESLNPSASRIDEILAKASEGKGLLPDEVATLIAVEDRDHLDRLGPFRLSDAEAAQADVAERLSRLHDHGRITLPDPNGQEEILV